MAISTNRKPTIYRNLYENTAPGRHETVTELINSGTRGQLQEAISVSNSQTAITSLNRHLGPPGGSWRSGRGGSNLRGWSQGRWNTNAQVTTTTTPPPLSPGSASGPSIMYCIFNADFFCVAGQFFHP